jgi:hypothetical protein
MIIASKLERLDMYNVYRIAIYKCLEPRKSGMIDRQTRAFSK